MKISSRICFLSLMFTFSFLNVQIATQQSSSTSKGGSVSGIFKQLIEKAKVELGKIKIFLKQFPKYVRDVPPGSYFSSNIAIAQPGVGGLFIDFGYSGAGPLIQPFNGLKVKLDFEKIPNFLENAVLESLSKIDFIDRLINIKPKDEFLFKFILLCLDLKKKKIKSRQFAIQILFLFWRLNLVKDFEEPKDLLTGPLSLILDKIKINEKSILDFLNDKWKEFTDIADYSFTIEEKPGSLMTKEDLIETNDWKTITKILTTIGLHSMAQYSDIKSKFIKTEQGKQFEKRLTLAQEKVALLQTQLASATLSELEQIKLSLKQAKRERSNIKKEMSSVMPGFADLKEKTKTRMIGFLRRVKGFRNFINDFKEKLRPILSPICDDMGMPYDAIFPGYEDFEKEFDPASLSEEELEEELAEMDLEDFEMIDEGGDEDWVGEF